MYLIYFLTIPLKRYTCCFKVSKWLEGKLFWSAYIRLMMESYIIGFICCLLNIRQLDFGSGDSYTVFNSVLTVIVLPIYVLFPILHIAFMYKNFKSLGQSQMKNKFGELYAGYSINNKSTLLFLAIDYTRKIVLCTIVSLKQESLQMQSVWLYLSSIIVTAAAMTIKAKRTNFDRRMDMFNEIKLLFIMYHMILFTDYVDKLETQSKIGFSCMFFVIFGTLTNIFFLFRSPIMTVRRKRMILKHLKMA